MSMTIASGPEPGAGQPKHPWHPLTTLEPRGYRRRRQSALAFFDTKDPVPPVRADLPAALDEVLTEQESRRRLDRCMT